MKKLFLALVLVVGLNSFAQPGRKGEGREKLTPEQQVESILKKMTQELALTEKQQNEIKPILVEQSKKREAKKEEFRAKREKGEKPSDEEIAEMKKNRADEELALKTKFKKILSEEQYNKWSDMRKQFGEKMKGKRKEGVKPSESK
jgi:periplasmic protein CpxP/Spy